MRDERWIALTPTGLTQLHDELKVGGLSPLMARKTHILEEHHRIDQ